MPSKQQQHIVHSNLGHRGRHTPTSPTLEHEAGPEFAADKVHAALLDLGYQCLYRSEDAANYVRAADGLDLLYAHRPLARRLLAQASERETPMGRMRIISVEGLIGFKLQGFVNDATRTRDLDDIRALLKIHRASLDMDEVREYFALFNKPDLLNELLG